MTPTQRSPMGCWQAFVIGLGILNLLAVIVYFLGEIAGDMEFYWGTVPGWIVFVFLIGLAACSHQVYKLYFLPAKPSHLLENEDP